MSTREELTRQAEKCLRQGRVDDAITQYQALAEMAPIDWGLVKQLADLLERAGQREGAAAQFCRWADHLFTEGFHSKAAALYKKVLKLDAAHEHALWQLAEVSLELKLRADARMAFQRAMDLRQRRNDVAGVAAARARLAELDATPVTGPFTQAPSPMVAAPTQPPPVAPSEPVSGAPAAAAVAPAAAASPAAASPAAASPAAASPAVASPVAASSVAALPAATMSLPPVAPVSLPPVAPAAPPPETSEARLARLRREAEAADAMRSPDADARWHAVLEAHPHDTATRLRLVQVAIERNDLGEAERLALPLDATEDPALIVLTDLAHRRGDLATVDRLISGRVEAGAPPAHVLAPVDALAEGRPDAARAVLSAAVTAWSAARQPGHAAGALERADARGLLTTALHLQWVEICVDAGLPALSRAQHALARAYLAEGRGAEARAVAEDLFVHDDGGEPWRGLLLEILDHEGVADPHRVLVDLLSPPSETADEQVVAEYEIPLDGDDFEDGLPAPVITAPVVDAPVGVYAASPDAPRELAHIEAPPVDRFGGWLGAAMPAHGAASDLPVRTASPSSIFDWADLLGRDVEVASSPAVAVPASIAAVDEPPQIESPDPPAVIVESVALDEQPSACDTDAQDPREGRVVPHAEAVSLGLDERVAEDAGELPDAADVTTPVAPEPTGIVSQVGMDDAFPAPAAAEAMSAPPPVVQGYDVLPVLDDARHQQQVAASGPIAIAQSIASTARMSDPMGESGPVVGADVAIVASDPPDHSLFRKVGELQPKTESVAPELPPTFLVPSSWLSADPTPTFFGERRHTPADDAYLFEDRPTPLSTAPRRDSVVPSAATAQPEVVSGSAAENDAPVMPVSTGTVEPSQAETLQANDRSADAPGRDARQGDAPLWPSDPAPSPEPPASVSENAAPVEIEEVEEEVDLTQLLEDLRQWDTVLPAPIARRGHEQSAAPAERLGDDTAAAIAAPEAASAPVASTPPPSASDATAADDVIPDHAVPTPGEGSQDLEAVFADLQRQTDDRAVAEQQLGAGRVFLAAGLMAEAARAFERASLEPRSRFGASQALAELHRSRGQLIEAVSWYEQAAMAPVPDAALKRAVLYDLAESLEALGETDRALGVLLDLLSQVEDYRDARARLDRLLRVDAGG